MGQLPAYLDIFTNPTFELLSTSITREVLKNHKLHKQLTLLAASREESSIQILSQWCSLTPPQAAWNRSEAELGAANALAGFMAARKSASEMIKDVKLKAVLDDFQFIIGFAEKELNKWELISESIDFVDSFSRLF